MNNYFTCIKMKLIYLKLFFAIFEFEVIIVIKTQTEVY